MNTNLETFISVYESRNFSIAAKELFVTQPTVSVRIEQLEKELATPLFVRKYRQEIVPTKAGELLYKKAIQIRELWQETQTEMRYAEASNRRLIRIGFSQTLAMTTVTDFLVQARAKYPTDDWEVTVANSEAISHLIANRKLEMGLVEKPIVTDTSVVKRKSIATDQLVRIGQPTGTWIIREPGSGIEHYTNLFFSEYDVIPDHTIVLNRNDLILNLVTAGVGETIISRSVLPKSWDFTELNPHFQRSLYFMSAADTDKHLLGNVFELLQEIIATIY